MYAGFKQTVLLTLATDPNQSIYLDMMYAGFKQTVLLTLAPDPNQSIYRDVMHAGSEQMVLPILAPDAMAGAARPRPLLLGQDACGWRLLLKAARRLPFREAAAAGCPRRLFRRPLRVA